MSTEVREQSEARLSYRGISHVISAVGPLDDGISFYRSVLGLVPAATESWHGCGENFVFAVDSGQHFIVEASSPPADSEVSARHIAWRVSPKARERILERVRGQGVTVFDYHEDRPAEHDENVYFTDPAGNRNQLVTSGEASGEQIAAIDHVAVEVNDAVWAERFFGTTLGWPVEFRMGWNTEDYVRAKAHGEAGMHETIPGGRYWNERYSPFETEKKALRPNPQLYYEVAGTCVAVYLAARHYQVPKDGLNTGIPRTGIAVEPGSLGSLAGLFEINDVAFEGPVHQAAKSPVARSIYVRDPGGNFFEFSELR